MRIKTEKIYFNNTKLFRVISTAGSATKKKTKKVLNVCKDINTLCSLWNSKADTEIPISNFDKLVIEIIGSIYDVSRTFTANDIAASMFSNFSQKKFSSTLIKHIEESIDKLSDIDIILDCKDEFEKRGIKYEFEHTKLLCLTKDKKQYTLLEEPILMTYAKAVSQYITLSADTVRIDKDFSENNALINRFLLTRIMQIKNAGNYLTKPEISYCWYDSKFKKYKGLLPYLSISKTDYKEHYKRRVDKIHQQVLILMNSYVTKDIIKSYKTIYKNELPQKITIELGKKNVAASKKKCGRKAEKSGSS